MSVNTADSYVFKAAYFFYSFNFCVIALKKGFFFFEYYKEILDVDYKSIVEKDSEGLECITFFVIVEAEDGEEHKIINDMNIIFVKKDGKYYTLG